MKPLALLMTMFYLTFSFGQRLPLSNQKTAVLILGNDAQAHARGHLDEIAKVFQTNGVFVYKFYFPNAKWKEIISKANSCSFFIYTGHGVENGGLDGEFGGLYINEFVMASDIVKDLSFQHKPLIIYLNACGSHGTSQDDPDDIGIREASNRVMDTALPFFMSGAGGYFATSGSLTGFFQTGFLQLFLDGTTLQDCYKSYVGDWQDIVKHNVISSHDALNNLIIGISSSGEGRDVSYEDNKRIVTESSPKIRYYGTAYISSSAYSIKSASLMRN